MTEFYDQFRQEFLSPSEDNFNLLVEKINFIYNLLSKIPLKRDGRRNLNSCFIYDDELMDTVIPDTGLGFEKSIKKSLMAFEGCIRWHSPYALFNIAHSPLLDTVALSTVTNLYNPNALWDVTSGKVVLLEKKVIKMLASLAGWNLEKTSGFSTYGGKATLMYAIKEGLNKCDSFTVDTGLKGEAVVLVSDACHFSIESVCNYLGVGKKNCIRVKTSPDGTMSLIHFRESLKKVIVDNRKIGCIILNGGGTINLCIDPIKEIKTIINDLVCEYNLSYIPHLHIDTVISWVFLFFINSNENTINSYKDIINLASLKKVQKVANALKEICSADSFGVDFHKTGLCPYISSFYISKDNRVIDNLNHSSAASKEYSYGDICNYNKTFENSRSCEGIINAYHVLQRLGKKGFQSYVIHFLKCSEYFKEVISEKYTPLYQVLNNDSLGYEIVIKINFFGNVTTYEEILTNNEETRNEYKKTCNNFFEFINYGNFCNNNNIPIIGYVPKYRSLQNFEGLPAFLLYPVSIHLNKDKVIEILENLSQAINEFERLDLAGLFKTKKSLDYATEPPK